MATNRAVARSLVRKMSAGFITSEVFKLWVCVCSGMFCHWIRSQMWLKLNVNNESVKNFIISVRALCFYWYSDSKTNDSNNSWFVDILSHTFFLMTQWIFLEKRRETIWLKKYVLIIIMKKISFKCLCRILKKIESIWRSCFGILSMYTTLLSCFE